MDELLKLSSAHQRQQSVSPFMTDDVSKVTGSKLCLSSHGCVSPGICQAGGQQWHGVRQSLATEICCESSVQEDLAAAFNMYGMTTPSGKNLLTMFALR